MIRKRPRSAPQTQSPRRPRLQRPEILNVYAASKSQQLESICTPSPITVENRVGAQARVQARIPAHASSDAFKSSFCGYMSSNIAMPSNYFGVNRLLDSEAVEMHHAACDVLGLPRIQIERDGQDGTGAGGTHPGDPRTIGGHPNPRRCSVWLILPFNPTNAAEEDSMMDLINAFAHIAATPAERPRGDDASYPRSDGRCIDGGSPNAPVASRYPTGTPAPPSSNVAPSSGRKVLDGVTHSMARSVRFSIAEGVGGRGPAGSRRPAPEDARLVAARYDIDITESIRTRTAVLAIVYATIDHTVGGNNEVRSVCRHVALRTPATVHAISTASYMQSCLVSMLRAREMATAGLGGIPPIEVAFLRETSNPPPDDCYDRAFARATRDFAALLIAPPSITRGFAMEDDVPLVPSGVRIRLIPRVTVEAQLEALQSRAGGSTEHGGATMTDLLVQWAPPRDTLPGTLIGTSAHVNSIRQFVDRCRGMPLRATSGVHEGMMCPHTVAIEMQAFEVTPLVSLYGPYGVPGAFISGGEATYVWSACTAVRPLDDDLIHHFHIQEALADELMPKNETYTAAAHTVLRSLDEFAATGCVYDTRNSDSPDSVITAMGAHGRDVGRSKSSVSPDHLENLTSLFMISERGSFAAIETAATDASDARERIAIASTLGLDVGSARTTVGGACEAACDVDVACPEATRELLKACVARFGPHLSLKVAIEKIALLVDGPALELESARTTDVAHAECARMRVSLEQHAASMYDLAEENWQLQQQLASGGSMVNASTTLAAPMLLKSQLSTVLRTLGAYVTPIEQQNEHILDLLEQQKQIGEHRRVAIIATDMAMVASGHVLNVSSSGPGSVSGFLLEHLLRDVENTARSVYERASKVWANGAFGNGVGMRCPPFIRTLASAFAEASARTSTTQNRTAAVDGVLIIESARGCRFYRLRTSGAIVQHSFGELFDATEGGRRWIDAGPVDPSVVPIRPPVTVASLRNDNAHAQWIELVRA